MLVFHQEEREGEAPEILEVILTLRSLELKCQIDFKNLIGHVPEEVEEEVEETLAANQRLSFLMRMPLKIIEGLRRLNVLCKTRLKEPWLKTSSRRCLPPPRITRKPPSDA